MAGGVGSRFWPASRETMPKQFLDITGSGRSLLRETVDRFLRFLEPDRIIVITHQNYIGLVAEHLPELKPDQIIGEPSRNNTAASIALASLKLFKKDPEAVCVVAPADHLIQKEDEFERVIRLACDHAAANGSIVTLGIEPTRPDTGYGYIEFQQQPATAVRAVTSFREKPDHATAVKYLASGNFAWNAGIFIWTLPTILEAFQKHSAQIYSILEKGMEVYNTDEEIPFIATAYPDTEKTSVDYAILEKADNVFVIPCDIGWSDLGTWNSLYEQSAQDEHRNARLHHPVVLEDTSDCLIHASGHKLVVIKGLKDFIVVDTDDCLLIYPKADEQKIKALKEELGKSGLKPFL
jgi:mannose-1-phosphate guanylyltransferase